jgi:hypothetical protein
MLRASEVEALYEGIAQKGFGVLGIDGSPVPLSSLWRGGSPQCHRAKDPVDLETQQSKTKEY